METTYTDCITFTGETSDFTLAVGSAGAKEWDGTVEYSTDHNTWTVWDGSEISSSGQKLYLRGSGNTTFYTDYGAFFILSERASCSGNIQTLLEYSNPPTSIPSVDCYRRMFSNCTNLITAPALPATTLANNCYNRMFSGCTSLTQAPALPATTLANYCYSTMFYGCTSLTTAPALPATTLTNSCYNTMFYGCTSLTTAPALPATTLANSCYNTMFYGCTSLTQAPALPATTLISSCYNAMFQNCKNLTQAPALPATTLANYCYSTMFYGCTSLTTAPALPATTLANNCYQSMFQNCTSLTQAPELPATTLANYCYSHMFSNCTSLKISATQSSEYPTAWRIPSSGTISSTATQWNVDMLTGTGGTFTSEPSINTTYYGAWSSVETYNITYNLTNCSGSSANPTTINEGDTAILSFTSNEGYSFPETITVTGVESYTWDKSTGTITLTNATGNVNIIINCIVVVYPKINSFTYHGKQIRNINGKPIRYVHDRRAGMDDTYEMVYVLQLSTPQNVTADGTTVSWDKVESATSYEIFADGISIGTVQVGTASNFTLSDGSVLLTSDGQIFNVKEN